MNVSHATGASQVYAMRSTQQYSTTQQTSATQVNASTDTVSISEKGRSALSNWQQIAAKYDVNNITGAEARQLSKDLFEGGFISTGEMMIIGAPMSMNESPTQRYDLLNDMRYTYQLSSSMGGHNKTSSDLYLKSIDVLDRLSQPNSET